MEHPLCKICDPPRRHSMKEPHVFPAPKPMTKRERERLIPQDDGTTLFVREAAKRVLDRTEWEPPSGGCPVCAERRAKKAAAQKRWRGKKATE